MKKLWLIKDKKGKIFGPYNEQEICFYIEEGEFGEKDFFSSYPAGKWKPLSVHSVFYEKILAQINKKPESINLSESSVSVEESNDDQESSAVEPTRIVAPKDKKSSQKKKIKIKLSEEFKEGVLIDEGVGDIIEMEDFKQKFFIKLRKSLKIPVLIFCVLLVFAFIFVNQNKKAFQAEHIRLLSLTQKRKPWSKKELKEKFRDGLLHYFNGNVSNHLHSQQQYIQILEGNPEELEAYFYLCLVYLEIWPFAYQDTLDRDTLNKTLDLASKRDRGGIYSGGCKVVQNLINRKAQEALMVVDGVLNADGPNNLIFLYYYLKAEALYALNKVKGARSYLQSVYKLRPEWIAPYILSAQMYYEKGEYEQATKLYQKVLSIFPDHISAGLRLGILEHKHLKKTQNSERRLESILMQLNDLVDIRILTESYIALASIYLEKNNKSDVLKYLNKAYVLDPEHPDVIMLKSKMGDSANFENKKIQAQGLIYKGDILFGQGKCFEAKKYFEKAYKIGNQKNALAAMRMAQCYWKSKVSGQAIRWLKRAINADSKMLEAYFLLSDYLSTLYNFSSARDVLNAVKSQNPSSYDLFKAYALLSFRQKQYSSAVTYAEKSLNFYTSDIEIYILLSKAYLALGEEHKAFANAQKALKEDINSIPAQISYGLALDLAYGSHRVKEHFEELTKRFPQIVEYPQALGEYYFNKSQYEEALHEFQQIIVKNPDFKPAYIYLGRIYNYLSYSSGKRGGKYEQALEYFLKATLLDISDPEPMFYTAQTHLQHKQYQLAENEFEKILRINSNYPLVHYYVGLVNFYQQGDKNLEKALKYARIQAAKTPKHYLPYKLAGDVYRLKSKGAFNNSQNRRINYELCAKEYQKALKYIKNDVETSIGLIECYKESGDLDSALQLTLQLTKVEGLSGYPELYKEIGNIFEAKEQYEKARAYYVSYFTLYPGAKDRKEIETRINRLIDQKKKISDPE